ncbi:hypothetical protein [Rhodoplanes azumiensis]|uniref:Uncharacterized protein n=1 Tax=Rhodoplanes azumiensis TaxID=1897628 RepID=A0ABW5AG28_9BRAD
MASDELARVGQGDALHAAFARGATGTGRGIEIIDGGPRAAAAPAVATGRGD